MRRAPVTRTADSERNGWDTAREVEIIQGRSRGWIDLLAFDPRTGLLLVVEIKTRLDDIGLVERQLAWYERSAFDVAHRLGWPARRVGVWLLALASAEVDAAIWANRKTLSLAFPVRAAEMATITTGGVWPKDHGRGLALIDPRSRRRDWLDSLSRRRSTVGRSLPRLCGRRSTTGGLGP